MPPPDEKALTPLEQAQADLESLHGHFLTVLGQRDGLVTAIRNIDEARKSGQPTTELLDVAIRLANGYVAGE